MDTTFLAGLIGSLVLVSGAAYPAKPVPHPAKSLKNWLFAVGGAVMLAYSTLNYLAGGAFFFIILQIFVNIASVLMLLNTPDRFDVPFLSVAGVGLVAWSIYLFEDYSTVFFILGLLGIAIGYALQTGTYQRNLSLTAGSALIALFSYLAGNWIFFWLNVFFAIFSGYYAWKLSRQNTAVI